MTMREIKFRGKRKDTDEWVYGDLVRNVEGAFAVVPPYKMDMNNICSDYEVSPETVGQFTGLHDTNGKEIYEGDILQYIGRGADIVGKIYYREVTFKEGSFCIYCKDLNIHSPISGYITNGVLGWDVVGNIHDTPELLKGGKE